MTLKDMMPAIRKGARFGLQGDKTVFWGTKYLETTLQSRYRIFTVEDLLSPDWEFRDVKVGDIVDYGSASAPAYVTKDGNIMLLSGFPSPGGYNFITDCHDYIIIPGGITKFLADNKRSRDWMKRFEIMRKEAE